MLTQGRVVHGIPKTFVRPDGCAHGQFLTGTEAFWPEKPHAAHCFKHLPHCGWWVQQCEHLFAGGVVSLVWVRAEL